MNLKSVLREKYRSQASRKGESCTKCHRFHLFETEDIYDKVSSRLQSMKYIKQWAVVRIVLDNIANLIVFIETTGIRSKYSLTKEFQYGRRIQLGDVDLSKFLLHYFFQSGNYIDKEFIDDHVIGYYQIFKEIDNIEQLSNFDNIRQNVLSSLSTEYDLLNALLKKLSIENEDQINQPQLLNEQFQKLEISDQPDIESHVDERNYKHEDSDHHLQQQVLISNGKSNTQESKQVAQFPQLGFKTIDIQEDSYEENVIDMLNDYKLFFMNPSKDFTQKQNIYNQLLEIDSLLEIKNQEQSQSFDQIRNLLIMIQTHIMQLKDTVQQNKFIKYYEDIFNKALLIAQSESS